MRCFSSLHELAEKGEIAFMERNYSVAYDTFRRFSELRPDLSLVCGEPCEFLDCTWRDGPNPMLGLCECCNMLGAHGGCRGSA